MGDTISGVQDDSGGSARSVEGENGLDGDVHGRCVEGLEHDLGHLLAVSLRVEGGLSQENGVFLGGNTELVVEGVMPDLLHVVPVGDDAVLNGVLQGQDTSLGLGLISDVGVLRIKEKLFSTSKFETKAFIFLTTSLNLLLEEIKLTRPYLLDVK